MIYVNKMDIMGADFFHVLDMVHDRLKANAVPIQLPIGKEDTFRGIVDLVEMKADIYYDDLGKDMREEEIPADLVELAQEYRTKLIEAVSDFDDEIMTLYLEGEDIPTQQLREAVRKATVAVQMVPVVCGTSYKNKGVQKLLRRHRGLYALSGGHSGHCRDQSGQRGGGHPPRRRRRALFGAGLQDHDRPYVGRLPFSVCIRAL
jgi:translation elongation factor EF-G